ncbi:hypothetical protein [Ciceribacter sp. L1K22]|uniref:hypothetical protein n=1 Tax=Ciceribacter sp. L1K22 TaxID=2820275 RepID=UPI001ABDF802|nr:hypothetical protein [Ciceribacter sp. L1K22]MBO3759529.1 hypothetical protein [Ciceribacter sp. L1K22]
MREPMIGFQARMPLTAPSPEDKLIFIVDNSGVVRAATAPYLGIETEWKKPTASTYEDWTVTREEIDAKLERTEARVERSVAELKSEFAAFEGRIDRGVGDLRTDIAAQIGALQATLKDTQHQTQLSLAHLPSKTFIVGTAFSIVAVLFGLFAFGATQFGNGIMAASSSVSQAVEAQSTSRQNAEQIAVLTSAMEELMDQIRQKTTSSAPSSH